jgi:F420-dependent oxidoreductase-like protein
MPAAVKAIRAAEQLGYESVWLGEAYGSDAVSALGYLASATDRMRLGSAVLQVHARTPAMTAMTAMTLDHLSGGRFALGLGLSGPQVVEGWHGVPFGRPLEALREYVDVVRQAIGAVDPVVHEGPRYSLPYRGDDASGLAKPIRPRLRPVQDRIPVLLATLGPRSVELTGEIADGWLPIFYSPRQEAVLCESLDAGASRRPAGLDPVEIIACPHVAMGPDIDECRDRLRPMLALYFGGMGAKGRNFYWDLAVRLGYGRQATEMQEAFLAGRKKDAAAAVPDSLVDEVCLVGPPEHISDQLEVWKRSRVGTLAVRSTDVETLRSLAALA